MVEREPDRKRERVKLKSFKALGKAHNNNYSVL